MPIMVFRRAECMMNMGGDAETVRPVFHVTSNRDVLKHRKTAFPIVRIKDAEMMGAVEPVEYVVLAIIANPVHVYLEETLRISI